MIKNILVAGAAALALAGCATPYTDLIQLDQQECAGGSQAACDDLPTWQAVDANYRAQRTQAIGSALAAGAATAAVTAAAIEAARHPPVVYYPAPQPQQCVGVPVVGSGVIAIQCQ